MAARDLSSSTCADSSPARGGPPGVLAVVVSYNPDAQFAGNLARLREQISEVVVVDNASADVEAVREACLQTGCRLICNPNNVGIATALNQGAAEAFAAGATWLATFDQDSLIPPGSIAHLLSVCDNHPDRTRIAVMAMAHRDRNTGEGYVGKRDVIQQAPGWRLVRSTITSGTLVRCNVLAQVGLFEERLFIDFVDHEFFMRLRRRQWLVLEASDVVMSHAIGSSDVRQVLGRPMVFTNHGPVRRYYMTRNQLEVYTRNLLFEPGWSIRGLIGLVYGTLAVLVFEDHRRAKFGAAVRGFVDFALRRFGPRP